MAERAEATVADEASGNTRLAVLLAMAMFVLVVDTSLMNVSISAVVRDLDTTASGVQSAIALEALVSAAFILIGSKVADLIGRKRAYVLGLLGYAIGALSMALAQNLVAIIVFWAIIGGLGASLLLPSMQSLIHGNFEGAAQKRAYALVGASAAIAAAVGPLVGGFITTYLSWRVAFLLEDAIIAIVLSGIGLVRDVPYTGSRRIDLVGALLSAVGMGGVVLGILVWQEGGKYVGLLIAVGSVALVLLVYWLRRRKREGKPTLLDPDLFKSKVFRFGVTGQAMQQIALGGTMIALPLFLQMVLEYNAMEAGLSLAPLSLTIFAVALVAGKKAADRGPSGIIRIGFGHSWSAYSLDPDRAASGLGLGSRRSADHRGRGIRLVGVAAQQLHARPDRRRARQRGCGRELGGGLVRTVVRPRLRGSDHAGNALTRLHDKAQSSDVLPPADQDRVADVLEDNAQILSNTRWCAYPSRSLRRRSKESASGSGASGIVSAGEVAASRRTF
jgi:MFS family permease